MAVVNETETSIERVSVAWALSGVIEIGIGLLLGNATGCQCTSNELNYVLLGLLSILIALVLRSSREMIAKQLDSWRSRGTRAYQ
ncbi:MAG: hypothetical protein KGH57_04085 [Candidatus Micrarchaeota archaeon]|nr:hypothetical protein [Candidatus Micrarchaeota archaeon]